MRNNSHHSLHTFARDPYLESRWYDKVNFEQANIESFEKMEAPFDAGSLEDSDKQKETIEVEPDGNNPEQEQIPGIDPSI